MDHVGIWGGVFLAEGMEGRKPGGSGGNYSWPVGRAGGCVCGWRGMSEGTVPAHEVIVAKRAPRQGWVWAFYPKGEGKHNLFAEGTPMYLGPIRQ